MLLLHTTVQDTQTPCNGIITQSMCHRYMIMTFVRLAADHLETSSLTCAGITRTVRVEDGRDRPNGLRHADDQPCLHLQRCCPLYDHWPYLPSQFHSPSIQSDVMSLCRHKVTTPTPFMSNMFR